MNDLKACPFCGFADCCAKSGMIDKPGLHASIHPFDALKYAPGNTLCIVEVDGEIIRRIT